MRFSVIHRCKSLAIFHNFGYENEKNIAKKNKFPVMDKKYTGKLYARHINAPPATDLPMPKFTTRCEVIEQKFYSKYPLHIKEVPCHLAGRR